jgi:quercetin dioxygenase-like cupin family protein
MKALRECCIVVPGLLGISFAGAEQGVSPRPDLILQKVVEGMPKGDKQEIRMLVGVIEPGQRTVFHTHPYLVGLYVLEGTFTLEIEGQQPVTVNSGAAMVEPPNLKMTGHNRGTGTMKALLFYVSDPGAPFLHVVTE